LATVYGIVTQHGGHIGVYSELGHGTTFKVYLPRRDAPVMLPPSTNVTPALCGGHEMILLVEDEPSVRDVAERILTTAGYRVLTAATPAEAINLFPAHATDISLLLTDVIMPGIDGPALYRQLAALRPELRVVFMSGYSKGIIQATTAYPHTLACIQKPFTADTLLQAIRSTLDMTIQEVSHDHNRPQPLYGVPDSSLD